MSNASVWGRLVKWVDVRLPVFSYVNKEFNEFPTPRNLNYFWTFGGIASFMLVVMIVTGVFLAMFYSADTRFAFDSVERIMRDVNYGWLIRYIHTNGGSMFFIAVYIHVFRGLYYGSYKAPREILWGLGVIILLLMMATAFMGYVLPWGQMSYWAATVITNLFSAIPWIGEPVVEWLWGGFTVGDATLKRFFSLHYLLPFLIFGVVAVHVIALHVVGNNNPLGIDTKGPQDSLPFHPYYTMKDTFAIFAFLVVFAAFVFFAPNYMGHPDNYVPANPLQTPPHIVPEWYFLPFYAILRAVTFDIWFISAKLIGVTLMFWSILILFFLPWLDRSPVRSGRFRPIFTGFFVVFIVDCIALGFAGANPPGGVWLMVGQIGTAYYFAHFLVVLPLLSWFEPTRAVPVSISEPVLKGGGAATGAAPAKPMEKA